MRGVPRLAAAGAVYIWSWCGATQAHAQGACCIDQDCVPAADEAECVAMGGVFLPGEDCADEPCGIGACCAGLSCVMTDAFTCLTGGREFMGAGTDCADDPCGIGVGACCLGGECVIVTPEECAGGGGTFFGIGTNCWGDPCELGACCVDDDCLDVARHECEALDGVFFPGLSCSADPCAMLNHCPDGSLFSQSRDEPDGFSAYTSEVSAGLRRLDDFSGVAGAVDSLVWWGVDLRLEGAAWVECEEADTTFEIAFHEDSGGFPGPEICSYTVVATRTPTGISYLGAELNEYSVALPEPCVLVRGWISIVGRGDPDCWFLWMSSGDGTGRSYCDGCIAPWESDDLGVCLLGREGGVPGACCDDTAGDCAEGTDIADCAGEHQRFIPEGSCDGFDPPCGVPAGACCFDDGNCTIELEEDCLVQGGNWLGAFTTCDWCPCVTPCPPGGIPEGEPRCHDDYVDEFNGGCDAALVAFSPIEFCETVCGEGGVFLRGGEFIGDFDWYEISVAHSTELIWSVQAEFRAGAWIVDGRLGCDDAFVIAADGGFECDQVTVSAPVEPGTYWLVVGPIAATDSAECGARYTATVSRRDDCPGDLDFDGDVDLADLAQLLANYDSAGGASYEDGDLDCDRDVDLSDLAALLAVYGRPCE